MPTAPQFRFTLRLKKSGETIALSADPVLVLLIAREWDFRMRNRNRWIDDDEQRVSIAELSREHLRRLGIPASKLLDLARAEYVEVAMDGSDSAAPPGFGQSSKRREIGLFSWLRRMPIQTMQHEFRRIPWESLLTMAVGKYQNHERLLVYRRLLDLNPHAEVSGGRPLKALFIESAPGDLQSSYDFDREHRAVTTYLQGVTHLERCRHPSLEDLSHRIAREKPDIIHLSGIDGYQGFQLLKRPADTDRAPRETGGATRPAEGVYFRGSRSEAKLESPDKVAEGLCAEGHRPILVTLNLYNSSASLASAIVENGAAAAIGFQDFIDDTVAEIFFTNVFSKWSKSADTPVIDAFNDAVHELAGYGDKVRGSGVTLWTRQSLLDGGMATRLCLPRRAEPKKAVTRTARNQE